MLASRRGTASYLLLYGATGVLLPVLALYYQSRGVTGFQLGVLSALLPVGNMIGAWLWGAIADGSGRHRLVLAGTILGAAVAAQALSLASSFLAFLPIVAVYAVLASPIAPMIDHGVLTGLGADGDRYGRVRLWGAIGWGIAGPAAGVLIDRMGLAAAFPMYGILMVGLLLVAVRLPVQHEGLGSGVRAGLRQIAASVAWRRFLLLVFAGSTGGAMVHHYLFVYLESIGASGTLRGLSLTVATVSELIVFVLAPRLLRRYRPERLILVSLAAISIRLILYAVIRDPYLALLPQMLHGVTFSLRLVAGVAIARRLAPPGMHATAQTLLAATQMGAAGIAGALIGGFLFRYLTYGAAFGWAGAVVGSVVLATLVRDRLQGRRR
jgi:PPP family 3-phenylpropionic acid transporter